MIERNFLTTRLSVVLTLVCLLAATIAPEHARAQAAGSPIELLQLSGPYHILPRENARRELTNQADGRPDMEQARGDNDRALWEFVAVENTNYVRIKSAANQTFLQNRQGELGTSQTSAQGDGTQWLIAPVDGEQFVVLSSRADGKKLALFDGKAVLGADPRDPKSAQWSLTSAGDFLSDLGRKGAPARLINDDARNSAYLEALQSCRDVGGYWTGGTCRAVVEGRRLECRRGWVWSDDSQECQWDGGGRLCPPWQAGSYPYCQADVACRGGNLRVTHAGYAVCDCPYGSALRGSYPNFRCGSAIGLSPVWLVPVIAGVVIGTLPKIIKGNGNPTPPPKVPVAGTCPQGQVWSSSLKSCIPANAGNPPLKQPIKTPLPIKSPTCSSNQHLVNNVCVDRVFKKPVLVCAAGMHAFNGKCVPIKKRPLPIVTPPKKVKVCPVRTHPVGNTCVANPTKCLPPHKMQNGKCV